MTGMVSKPSPDPPGPSPAQKTLSGRPDQETMIMEKPAEKAKEEEEPKAKRASAEDEADDR